MKSDDIVKSYNHLPTHDNELLGAQRQSLRKAAWAGAALRSPLSHVFTVNKINMCADGLFCL